MIFLKYTIINDIQISTTNIVSILMNLYHDTEHNDII